MNPGGVCERPGSPRLEDVDDADSSPASRRSQQAGVGASRVHEPPPPRSGFESRLLAFINRRRCLRRATEIEVLINRLVTLESRAHGFRTAAGPDLRKIEDEHGHLLGELVKQLVRARLSGRPLESVERGGADPLAQRRQKVHGRMLHQFTVWDADHAAGRPLPPHHDAMKYAEPITQGGKSGTVPRS